MQRTRTRAVAGGSEEPPASPSWVRAVKQLDFYYKADAEAGLLKRSKYGGMVTIVCGIILAYLVLSELVSFLSADTVDVLTVDKRRGEKMSINLDLYFPALTCVDVAVDVVEASSGETIEEATHQIIKQRTDVYGKPLAEGVQKDLGSAWFRVAGGDCPSCLPKESVPLNILRFAKKGKINRKQCCYSCDDVRNFLLENGIPQTAAEHTEQCKIEKPVQENEGCRIRGFLEVPRGKGDFHIAAGAGFSQNHESHQHHMHQIDWSKIHKFNISHVINSLSFGPPLPNVVNPLDSHKVIARSLAQHSYMIQVVPTTYESGSVTVQTNQYTFTQHHQKILGGQNFVLPGVYFKYDINPLMIEIKDHNPGVANFLTRICAIVGGLYVVFGLVYSVSSKVVKTTTKKR